MIGEQVHARCMVDEPPRPSEDSCHFCYPQHQTGLALSSLKNEIDCRTGRGGGLASSNLRPRWPRPRGSAQAWRDDMVRTWLMAYAKSGSPRRCPMASCFQSGIFRYESARLVHGRVKPLSGKFFENIFVHYMPASMLW